MENSVNLILMPVSRNLTRMENGTISKDEMKIFIKKVAGL